MTSHNYVIALEMMSLIDITDQLMLQWEIDVTDLEVAMLLSRLQASLRLRLRLKSFNVILGARCQLW